MLSDIHNEQPMKQNTPIVLQYYIPFNKTECLNSARNKLCQALERAKLLLQISWGGREKTDQVKGKV